MTLKEKTYNQYLQYINDRVQNYRNMIADLSEDAQNDAKGSAGDKHETALAMMHLEQEKLNYKLKEVLDQKAILESIDSTKKFQTAALGSLIYTDSYVFFLATALPKLEIDGQNIIALSPNSPLGIEMIGKKENEYFYFNKTKYTILSID